MATKSKLTREVIDDDDVGKHPEDGGKLKAGPGQESFKLAKYWIQQVESYEQATRRWYKRGTTVIKRFRDERNRIDEEGQRRMNLLWANIKVMKPAIYSRMPDPVIDRTFLDHDTVGRLSSQILERTIFNEMKENGYHTVMNMAVLDRLLPGRGIIWLRYVPEIGQGPSLPSNTINAAEDQLYKIGKEEGDKDLTTTSIEEDKLEQTQEQVISEKVIPDYLDWQDFYHFPPKARIWEEIQAVGKRIHITKKQAIEAFGEKIARSLKPDTTVTMMGNTERQTYSDTTIFEDIHERNIVVFEIWNKSDKRIYWVSPGYEYICKVVDDPLGLKGFFPIPPPLYATTTNDTLIPVPDYIEWQDQAIQIDELTQRLAMLTKACKVAGVYNASQPGINRIFNESIENELIPVDQWAMFAEAGGLEGQIAFVPIDQVIKAIETLMKVRQQAMIDLDQITGLSDVIRGTTDSRETLGGLRLKNNNAGTRLSESQEEVARFCRDVIRIMAEIVAKHFDDETLIQSSGILYEDALQPDTVMREWENDNRQDMLGAQQEHTTPQAGMPGQPAGGQQQGGAPSPLPMQQQPATPQIGAAQGSVGSNVVPFPGAQGGGQPQPQSPQGMQGMEAQSPQGPQSGQVSPMQALQLKPDPKALIMMKVDKAIKLIREDVRRDYRIDIETDSTVFGDKMQERADATEFLTALGGYMSQAEKLEGQPEALPLFAKALQWGVRRYRTGRDLEAEIDNFAEIMSKKAKQMMENPQPSPEQMKAQAEVQKVQMTGQIQAQNDQRDAQRQQQEHQMNMTQMQADHQMQMQKQQQEMQIERERAALEKERLQMEAQFKQREFELKLAELQAKLHVQHEQGQMKMQESAIKVQGQQQSQAMDIQHQSHTQAMERQQMHEEGAMKKEQMRSEHAMKEKGFNLKVKEQNQAHKHKMQQMKQKPKATAGGA